MSASPRCARWDLRWSRAAGRSLLLAVLPWLPVLATSRPAEAQVVQLPERRVVGWTGTVVAPDQGAALLGGAVRAARGTVRRAAPGLGRLPWLGRLLANRSLSLAASRSQASVRATIVDLREWDAAVSAAGGGRRETAEEAAIRRKAAFITRHVGRPDRVR